MSITEPASQYIPRVTKSIIKSREKYDAEEEENGEYETDGEESDGYYTDDEDLAHFDDSDTVIFIINGSLYTSFNSGENWQIVDTFGEYAYGVEVDPFHKNRAFVTSRRGNILVTEDQGRNWKELHIPKELGENTVECSRVETHPIDKRLLLIGVSVRSSSRPSELLNVICASDDSGQNFRRITPPYDNGRYHCHFVVSSEDSNSDHGGIYCIHEAAYRGSREYAFHDGKSALFHGKSALSYTTDFGKTTRVFDELNGLTDVHIFIFPFSVIIFASEDKLGKKNKNLWVSRDGLFEPLQLPDEVVSLEYARCSHGDDRLSLEVKAIDSKDHGPSDRSLVLDPSNLDFSWDPIPRSEGVHKPFRLDSLKGILWRAVDIQLKGHVTEENFGNKNWGKTLVVHPYESHKVIFDDYLWGQAYFGEYTNNCDNEPWVRQNDPTAGIIVETGAFRDTTNDMTFISRNGGTSWEIAFEFPVSAAFLDFGNIIVAVPWEESKICSKIYFSLDQGRTWNDYLFDEAIPTDWVFIYTMGLKALIRIKRGKKRLGEYVFYLLDFSNIFGGAACTEDDLERWYLYSGKCIDGVRYGFDRRKPDAKCLVRKTFKDLELRKEKCES